MAGCAALGGTDAPSLQGVAPVSTTWNQPVPAGAAPADLRTWWKALGDPALDALVEEALARNLDLAQAASRLREARLQSGRAALQFRPSLSASARSLQDISATDTYFHASIDMVWELGLFGAAQSTRQAGEAELDAAGADAQGVRVAVIADVVRNYLDLRAAGRQVQWLTEMAALDERSAALAEVRLRTRLGPADDIAQARVRAAQTRAAQTIPREAGARAAQALAVLLGRTSPDPAWSAARPGNTEPTLPAFALAELPADLLRTRPDVHAAEAEVHKAAAALGLARSELYPRIALMGSLLYSYNITQHFRTRSENAPALGPVIDIPLFDWGRRRMQVDARQEAMNAALIGYQRAVNNGVAEAEGALSALGAQQARADALAQALGLLQERIATGQQQRRLGLASEYDSLPQRRAALQAAAERDTAQDASALAFVALYKALGGAPLPAADTTAGAAATATVAAKAGGAP
ncbi:efflux transporter, outer membrane factor (OMF) lipoprotein, NodT family [Paracidovorax valerianellae]|uniref:Efflux transporter, outer membrane factor (OMF) lipoprotein, NodT family n=2 Tax=Paracidovorax valerianellae TaxID=187868 RepID=A0A1G7CI12_9BURK|nr:efflux transporter, outer membrane factor (OMF) lipoprotein, NodT family [Paracidovorax valerianellae]